ncbi:6,7-dimethyl-8-ribityllumazine synthase [candidate division WOR-3 bacterium]|nr:6,7-dimethyl-8-ribityllumazine synthase [candidate division WOR-3 bacterium]
MPVVKEGKYSGKGKKIALIASRFNSTITARLIDGALDALRRHEVLDQDIFVVWVPGAFEIPPVAKLSAESGKYDAVICLGSVIRGDTPHFDYVAAEVSKGIASVGISSRTPVIYGIITADSQEQALDRSGIKSGNKGFDGAMTALEMANLYSELE